MTTQLKLGDIAVDVVRKDIKNVHLAVHPPTGRVSISAPTHLSLDTIRVFAISKLDWIKKQQTKIQEQDRERPREFLERESHYVWGKRYLLTVSQRSQAPHVELTHSQMHLVVRPGTDEARVERIVEAWYREQLKSAVLPLLAKWEPVIGVKVGRVFVQRMKTRWGTCNTATGSIRLNTDLAKKPRQCLEYVVVHEMVHLLERTHNARFVSLMDRLMPHWRVHREQLNRLPVRHETWAY